MIRLLLDQNLSPKLVDKLRDVYPDSIHVSSVSLHESPDLDIWRFAREKGLLIVTKDADFSEMSTLRGHPPKVL